MPTEVAERVPARARRLAVSAGVPIVAAKITAPGVPDWVVPRRRVTELIAQGTRWCPLTVLTGPAGAGKTMALALWAAAKPGTVAWVSVDEFDNRPGVFWAYVVAALRRSGVALPATLPAARGRDAGHVFLLGLAAALAAQDPPVTLVLDDLHLLTGPAVPDGLDYLLRNAKAGLRLIVFDRGRFAFGGARHRGARFALASRRDDHHFVARQRREMVERIEAGDSFEIAAIARHLDRAIERAASHDDATATSLRRFGDGAHARYVRGESRHQHAARGLADQSAQGPGDVAFRKAVAFAQNIGRVADQRGHALVPERAQPRFVDAIADARIGVDLPVPRVHREPRRSADGQGAGFRNGMSDGDIFDAEGAEIQHRSRPDPRDLDIGRARLRQAARFDEPRREGRREDAAA